MLKFSRAIFCNFHLEPKLWRHKWRNFRFCKSCRAMRIAPPAVNHRSVAASLLTYLTCRRRTVSQVSAFQFCTLLTSEALIELKCEFLNSQYFLSFSLEIASHGKNAYTTTFCTYLRGLILVSTLTPTLTRSLQNGRSTPVSSSSAKKAGKVTTVASPGSGARTQNYMKIISRR